MDAEQEFQGATSAEGAFPWGPKKPLKYLYFKWSWEVFFFFFQKFTHLFAMPLERLAPVPFPYAWDGQG